MGEPKDGALGLANEATGILFIRTESAEDKGNQDELEESKAGDEEVDAIDDDLAKLACAKRLSIIEEWLAIDSLSPKRTC